MSQSQLYEWIKASENNLPEGQMCIRITTNKKVSYSTGNAGVIKQYLKLSGLQTVIEWLSPVSTDWGKLEKDFYEWKEEYMLYATEPPTPHYLFEWFKKKLGSQQHQDSIVPCVAQVDSSNSIGQKPTPPAWYTRDGMFEFLRNRNYCVEIANELADTWASILQGAFKKGWEKGYNDFNPEKGTFDYTYASKETVQALLTSPASKKDIED